MIVIIDFDGTLALGDTQDLENMLPNITLISLINEMYNDGNIINIVTARGSKSCNTKEEKEEKYLNKIKKWLKKYNISYHNISFNKEYGDIYIDDRCYNVKETFFYEKLDSKFTENKVRRFNDSVIKKTTLSINEFKWYKEAEKLNIKTPTIYTYDIDTISTEFLNGKICKNFDLSLKTLNIFMNTPAKTSSDFKSYILRIDNHLKNNLDIKNGEKLMSDLSKINIPNTFNHGDFSVFNSIEFNNEIYFIDPIFSDDLFQSYYLDIAKHLFSILYYLFDYDLYSFFREKYIENFSIDEQVLDILITSESVRV